VNHRPTILHSGNAFANRCLTIDMDMDVGTSTMSYESPNLAARSALITVTSMKLSIEQSSRSSLADGINFIRVSNRKWAVPMQMY
jgi:hypothetical protein